MTDEYKKIADRTDVLSAQFSLINNMLSDEWKTKSGEAYISSLKKILSDINNITDEIRSLSGKDVS